MYQNVFERSEKKYLITQEQQQAFLSGAADFLQPDQCPETPISNLYYDTAAGELIENSIARPLFKQKVRLRTYKVPTLDDAVFLELKTKYDGTVFKRRQKLRLRDFYDYYHKRYQKDHKHHQSNHNQLQTNHKQFQNKHYHNQEHTQIFREIDYLFSLYHLEPFCLVSYHRQSFRGTADENVRITFDENLRSRRTDLRLEDGDHGELYFDHDERIMEIKVTGAYPLWLAQLLSSLHIYPTTFSKIGRIYQKERSIYYADQLVH